MEYNIYLVDSFTDEAFKGNPAGVVPNAKRLCQENMQKIARELNVLETAFVTSIDINSYKIRYFTAYREVDFCGHSTLATFYALALKGYITPIETGIRSFNIIVNKKKLKVEIYFYNYEIENILVKMGTPSEIGQVKEREEFLKTLNLDLADINFGESFKEIPIIELGARYAFIAIKEKEKLDNLNINRQALKAKLEEMDIEGVHLFYLSDRESTLVYCRNFKNEMYLIEEPATGSANGSLIYLLKKNDLISGDSITSIQGEEMGRKSTIYCNIKYIDDKYKVEVAGKGKVVLEGIINVE